MKTTVFIDPQIAEAGKQLFSPIRKIAEAGKQLFLSIRNLRKQKNNCFHQFAKFQKRENNCFHLSSLTRTSAQIRIVSATIACVDCRWRPLWSPCSTIFLLYFNNKTTLCGGLRLRLRVKPAMTNGNRDADKATTFSVIATTLSVIG
jgi:hypothetical protein